MDDDDENKPNASFRLYVSLYFNFRNYGSATPLKPREFFFFSFLFYPTNDNDENRDRMRLYTVLSIRAVL